MPTTTAKKSDSTVRDFEPQRRNRAIPGAQSIARAMTVLRAVGTAPHQASTLSAIAGLVGLKIPTTRRALQALANEGFLIFDETRKTYQLGPELIALTARGDEAFAIRDLLMTACREIAAKTSDTTVLMIPRGDRAVCVGRVEGAFPIRVMSLDVGSVRPLGAGSGSLALIAFLPERDCQQVLCRNASEFGRFDLTLDDILEQAALARHTGFTLNPGRILPGVAGVGIPIFREGRVVASISVIAIERRLDPPRRAEVVTILKEAIRPLQSFSTSP